jgi:hypothetical protein
MRELQTSSETNEKQTLVYVSDAVFFFLPGRLLVEPFSGSSSDASDGRSEPLPLSSTFSSITTRTFFFGAALGFAFAGAAGLDFGAAAFGAAFFVV